MKWFIYIAQNNAWLIENTLKIRGWSSLVA